MADNAVLEIVELGFQWPGLDPFIMTMHHLDEYPEGNEAQGACWLPRGSPDRF